MKQRLDYNLNWGEYFRADTNSPSGLIRFKNYHNIYIDEYNVGNKIYQRNGDALAWQVSFQGRMYYVHRIIWVLKNGSIDPELVIDHLDGNPFNNNLDNLSLKTLKGNGRNQRRHLNNTTGITGVSLTNKGRGYFYYTAFWIELNGALKVKNFSIFNLGEDNAKSLAIAYREEQITRLILEGADYTERHGLV